MDSQEEAPPPSSLGFEEVIQPPAPPPSAPESAPTPEENKPAEDAPINIVAEGPPPQSETARKNQEIFNNIMAARNAPPAVPAPQPPIPRVLDQTKAEMEAGRSMNQHYEKLKSMPKAQRRVDPPRPGVTTESTSFVHRPRDYVPDFNHGYVNAQSVGPKT